MAANKSRSTKKAAEETNPDFTLPGIGNYVFVKTIGEGNFAKVKLAKHRLTGQEVAIKIIDKTQLDEKKVSKLYREVRIMKLLHHPHIVRLYEVIETKSTVFLVMECCSGGELYDYLVVHGRMKEREARAKFRQILSAVSYCHKKKVIHRDLKAENLLLDENLDIKIADFGFSNLYDLDSKLDTFCGSPPYAAPELFQGRRYTGPEVDVWSLGVILYVLTTGCLPFDGKNLQEMRESVCRGKYRIPFYLSESCEKLLRKFLIRDPYKRASLDILIDDPWINDSFTDSPITVDIASKPVEEDLAIMKVMETKFHIDKASILKSLREGIYDDVAAIYYLMYHERGAKGEIPMISPATVKVVPLPLTAAATATESGTVSMAAAPVSGLKKPGDMVPISEDEVLPDVASSKQGSDNSDLPVAQPRLNTRTSNVPRRRRFTVGGEADVKQYADDDEGREAAAALKLLQENKNPTASLTATKEEGDVATPVLSLAHKQTATEKSKAVAASSGVAAHPPVTLPKIAPPNSAAVLPTKTLDFSTTSTDTNPEESTSAHASEEGMEQSGRKRHNTIVGLLRNTIRRQSEAQEVPGSGTVEAPRSASPNGSIISTTATLSAASQETRAPSPDGMSKPRSLRFTFNSNTTSSKPPDQVVAEVVAAANEHGVQHKLVSRYLLECSFNPPAGQLTASGAKEVVKFEIEVCKLPRLRNLHGLRFKRLSGASADYKEICEKLLGSVAL